MKVITIEKVPKKLMDVYRDFPLPAGVSPTGVTLLPKKTDGFRRIAIYIQEKMSQYKTRIAIAHELFHVLQYLTGCEAEEKRSNEIDEMMVAALVEKRKKRAE